MQLLRIENKKISTSEKLAIAHFASVFCFSQDCKTYRGTLNANVIVISELIISSDNIKNRLRPDFCVSQRMTLEISHGGAFGFTRNEIN